MRKAEFKKYLSIGLGKCAVELASCNDRNKYRDIVLRACLRPQTENVLYGTRAQYLYDLLSFFEDDKLFFDTIIIAFNECSLSRYPFFAQLCDLLVLFSMDECKEAESALHCKYAAILKELLSDKVKPESYRCFEYVCVGMLSLYGEERIWESIKDISDVFCAHPNSTEHFGWYLSIIGDWRGGKLWSRLCKKAEKDPALRRVVKAGQTEYSRTEKENKAERAQQNLRSAFEKGLPYKNTDLLHIEFGGREQGDFLAELIRKEKSMRRKSKLLSAVSEENNAFAPQELITFADSDDPVLSRAGWKALIEICPEGAHDFAFEVGVKSPCADLAAAVLAQTYRPEDRDLFLYCLQKVSYRSADAHLIFSTILNAAEQNNHLPKESLTYIYENFGCDFCRMRTVALLSKRRMFTRSIAAECLYDSSDEVREFAEKKLKRTKSSID